MPRPPSRILVPTDFSDASSAARAYASTLAAALGARLHVLHVIPDAPIPGDEEAGALPEFLDRARREVQGRLDAWLPADDQRRLDAVNVQTGRPDTTIVRYAEAHAIDLIVMGRGTRSRRNGSPLGRVAAAVLERARCPVMAVQTSGS